MGFGRPGSKHNPHMLGLPFTSLGVSLPTSYSGTITFRLYLLWESQGTRGSVAGGVGELVTSSATDVGLLSQPKHIWKQSQSREIVAVSSELVCSHIAQEATALSQYFLHCIWRGDSSACHCQLST